MQKIFKTGTIFLEKYLEAQGPLLTAKISFVRIDPADWKLPGNNKSVSNSVFSVNSSIVLVLRKGISMSHDPSNCNALVLQPFTGCYVWDKTKVQPTSHISKALLKPFY